MRTQNAFYADLAHGGGWEFYNASQILAAGSFTYTRTAGPPITVSYNLTSTQSGQVHVGLADLKRLLEYPGNFPKTDAAGVAQQPFQERFGTGAGNPGWPASVAGFPPFTGATELTPPTADPGKGLQILNIVCIYSIGSVNATTNTLGVYRNVFANNVAIAQTTLYAATAMSTTAQTNPYVTTVALSLPMETTDLSDIFCEVNVTAGSGGTYAFYGIGFHMNFNYN